VATVRTGARAGGVSGNWISRRLHAGCGRSERQPASPVSEAFVMRTLTSAFLALSVSFPVAIAKEGPGSGELPAATTIAADQTPQGPNEEQLIAEAKHNVDPGGSF